MIKVYNGLQLQARQLGAAKFLQDNIGAHDRVVEERDICGLPVYTITDGYGNKFIFVIRSYLFTNMQNYKNSIEYFRDEKLDEKIEDELTKIAIRKKAAAGIVNQIISFNCEMESTDNGMFNASINVELTDVKYLCVD